MGELGISEREIEEFLGYLARRGRGSYTARSYRLGLRRALDRAREIGEPSGQLAARELEVERIRGAPHRARELRQDAAAALEEAAV
jgi:hypothetical protein